MKRIYSYWWSEVSNFGDRITPYLIEKITGKLPIHTATPPAGEESLFATGSILQLSNKQSVVWGSGFIEKQSTPIQIKNIYAVRGCLTKKNLDELGISCPEVYGDPGLLIPRFYYPNIQKKFKVGIVPHYVDKENKLLNQKDISIIDVQESVEKVIDSILSCDIILSSSLHGLIIADAYGIPSCWVEFSDKVYGCGFKFHDYYSSMKCKVKPIFCKSLSDIQRAIKTAKLHEVLFVDELLSVFPYRLGAK